MTMTTFLLLFGIWSELVILQEVIYHIVKFLRK